MEFKSVQIHFSFFGPHTSLIIENNLSTSVDLPGMANAYCAKRKKFISLDVFFEVFQNFEATVFKIKRLLSHNVFLFD
jgi:hypothetical protein